MAEEKNVTEEKSSKKYTLTFLIISLIVFLIFSFAIKYLLLIPIGALISAGIYLWWKEIYQAIGEQLDKFRQSF